MGLVMGQGVNRLDNIGGDSIGMNRRRPLALLFTDIASSTALAATMEPEEYADILTAVRTALQSVMDRHEGQVIRVDGDGALCMFGYSGGAEHAGKMAALAALDFHAEVAAIARGRGLDALNLHSGIHAGMVLLRQGDLVRGRYEVIGDATNIAARLCDAAGADDILISRDALGPDAAHFALGLQRSITLHSGARGRDRRIAAYSVHGLQAKLATVNAGEASSVRPMFGRDSELDLARAWFRAQPSDAPIFYVQAEAGGGKSRLLHAIGKEGATLGLRVAYGQCDEDYLSAPLQPMVQLARALAMEDGPKGDLWALQQQIRGVIIDAARQSPLLMVIDDWQWADDATKRMVEQCLTSARGQIRLLVASRTDDPGLEGRRPEWTLGSASIGKGGGGGDGWRIGAAF